MSYYQQFRPENALPKAIDLEKVGKPQDAYKLLSQALTNKSRSKVWSSVLEESVLKFIELAVKLRSPTADIRNVLSNFKASTLSNSASAMNPASFTKAIRYLITCTEKATTPFITQSIEIEEESAKSPEALAQFAFEPKEEDSVNARGAKTLLENRFLWDVYRTALDLVRNNHKTFGLYHEVLRSFFASCNAYKNYSEFRRVTSNIRDNHSSTAQIANQLGDDEQVQEAYLTSLQTRLSQLATAHKLEVWSETSNTIMDIHDLLKTLPHTSEAIAPTLALVLTHISNFFWLSRNYTLHAYALWRLYQILSTHSSLVIPEIQLNLTPVQWCTSDRATVLSGIYLSLTLAQSLSKPRNENNHITAPLQGDNHILRLFSFKGSTETNTTKYNAIFGLPEYIEPSVSHLLSVLPPIASSQIIPGFVRSVFNSFNSSVSPLKITRVIVPFITEIREHGVLTMYADLLNVALLRYITYGVSQLYNTISIERFRSIIPQTEWTEVEPLLTQMSIESDLFLLINHHNSTLSFTPSPNNYAVYAKSVATTLSSISQNLIPLIDPHRESKMEHREVVKISFADCIHTDISQIQSKHAALIAKREEIEREFREEEERKRLEAQRIIEEKQRAEEQRRAEEQARLQKQKEDEEEKERQRAKKQQILDALSKSVQTVETQDLKKNREFRRAAALAEKNDASERDLIAAARKVELQKRQEAQRLKVEERRTLDYLVRAQRDAQRQKLLKTYDEDVKQLDEIFQKRVEDAREKHKADYDIAIKEKKRLALIEPDRKAFREAIMVKRRERYEAEMAQYQKDLEVYTKEKARRDEERRKADEERRQREEEERQIAMEEEAKLEAEEEKRRIEEEKKRAEDDRRRGVDHRQQRPYDDRASFRRGGGGDAPSSYRRNDEPSSKSGGTSWLLNRAKSKADK